MISTRRFCCRPSSVSLLGHRAMHGVSDGGQVGGTDSHPTQCARYRCRPCDRQAQVVIINLLDFGAQKLVVGMAGHRYLKSVHFLEFGRQALQYPVTIRGNICAARGKQDFIQQLDVQFVFQVADLYFFFRNLFFKLLGKLLIGLFPWTLAVVLLILTVFLWPPFPWPASSI